MNNNKAHVFIPPKKAQGPKEYTEYVQESVKILGGF